MFQSPDEDSFAPKLDAASTFSDSLMDLFQSPDEDSFAPKDVYFSPFMQIT